MAPPKRKESRALWKEKGKGCWGAQKKSASAGKDASLPLKTDTLAQFSQVTDLPPSRASLLNQSMLTDGSRISDLEVEGSICNPRVAQVPREGLRGL